MSLRWLARVIADVAALCDGVWLVVALGLVVVPVFVQAAMTIIIATSTTRARDRIDSSSSSRERRHPGRGGGSSHGAANPLRAGVDRWRAS